VGAEQQAALLEGGRHASAELTGSGALPSPGSRPHSPHPQQPWRPSPGSSLRPAGSVGSAAAAPGSRQLSTQLPPSQQGAAAPQPGGLSDKELQELVDRAQRRASQAMRQHSTEAAAGGAAAPPNGQALGGGGGSFGAPRPAPSLPRINSRQSLAGGEEESEGLSGSSNSRCGRAVTPPLPAPCLLASGAPAATGRQAVERACLVEAVLFCCRFAVGQPKLFLLPAAAQAPWSTTLCWSLCGARC
jgi:hypothetical protein